jgi:hypothetical protein
MNSIGGVLGAALPRSDGKPSNATAAAAANSRNSALRSDDVERRALRGSKIRTAPKPYPDEKSHTFSAKALSLIGPETSRTIVTKAQIEKLTALDADYKSNACIVEDHTDDRAKDAFYRQLADTVDALKREGANAIKDAADWGLEDFKESFKFRREAAITRMRAICEEARPIIEEIVNDLTDAAAELAEKMDAQERAECARFGVAFRPSPQLVTIARADHHIKSFAPVPGSMSFSPAQILRALELFK